MSEPAFRASKRRKVFRQRTGGDIEDEEVEMKPASATRTEVSAPEDSENRGDAMEQEDSSRRSGVSRVVKPKRHGIAFSSNQATRSQDEPRSEQTALVKADLSMTPDIPSADRFVRPTGKAMVTEDKHMSAFIDSKLAELRSQTATPVGGTEETSAQIPSGSATPGSNLDLTGHRLQQTTSNNAPLPKGQTQRAQMANTQLSKPNRRRRGPIRSEADIARDSLIDQIMSESQVPIYDRAEPSNATPRQDGDGVIDNDAAAAAAFKADFLAAMEERNLHRRPPAPPAAGASSGPKLGGSRAQRERMRAMEEQAKAKK